MGWCSATEIMDTAITSVATSLDALMEWADNEHGIGLPASSGYEQARWEAMRPFVASLATHLRDADWDCVEESIYFTRFPQEMLGLDDRGYVRYLHDRLMDTRPDEHDFANLVRRLAEVTKRLETED